MNDFVKNIVCFDSKPYLVLLNNRLVAAKRSACLIKTSGQADRAKAMLDVGASAYVNKSGEFSNLVKTIRYAVSAK